MKIFKKNQKGFTLIELLIVVAILTILAVAVFTALNPAQRLKDSKDARRATDVQEILTAVHQAVVDNNGNYPGIMPAAGTEKQLGTTGSGCDISNTNCTVTETACANLMSGTINLSTYLKSMPIDPNGGSTYTSAKTGYTILRDANGIVTVKACATDGASVIQASR